MLSLSLRSATDTLPLDGLVSGEAGVQATSGALGFGLPPLAHQWVEGAGHGATHRGYRALSRTIDLPLTIEAPTRQELRALLRRLSLILAGPATLRAHDSADGAMWDLEVVRSGGGDYTYGTDTTGDTSLDMVVTLTAGDPFWTRVDQSSFLVETPNPGQGLLPQLTKMTLAGSQAFGSRVVENPGDVETYPVWKIDGPGKNFEAKSAKGETLRWTGTLGINDTLHIDSGKGTVVDGKGVNRYSELAPAPRFFPIQPGTSEVSVKIDESSVGTMVPVRDVRTNLFSNPLPTGTLGSTPSKWTPSTSSLLTQQADADGPVARLGMKPTTPRGFGCSATLEGPSANGSFPTTGEQVWRVSADVRALRPGTAFLQTQVDSASSGSVATVPDRIAITPDMGWRRLEGLTTARPDSTTFYLYAMFNGEGSAYPNLMPDAEMENGGSSSLVPFGGAALGTWPSDRTVGAGCVSVFSNSAVATPAGLSQSVPLGSTPYFTFAADIARGAGSGDFGMIVEFRNSSGAILATQQEWRPNVSEVARVFERRWISTVVPAGATTATVKVAVRGPNLDGPTPGTYFLTDGWDAFGTYYDNNSARASVWHAPDVGNALLIRRVVVEKVPSAEAPGASGFFYGGSPSTDTYSYRYEGTGTNQVSIEAEAEIRGITRITCAWRPRAWTVI